MKETVVYNCEACQTRDFIEGVAALKKHMLEVHGIDTATTKGTRQMTAHLDGRDFFQSTYKFTFQSEPPVTVTYTEYCKRAKNDMMRYA